jgi:hypothetical protein
MLIDRKKWSAEGERPADGTTLPAIKRDFGMSRRQLWDQLQVRASTLHRICCGRKSPSHRTRSTDFCSAKLGVWTDGPALHPCALVLAEQVCRRSWPQRHAPALHSRPSEADCNPATIVIERTIRVSRRGDAMPHDGDQDGQPRIDGVAVVEHFSMVPDQLPAERQPRTSERRAYGNRSRARPDVYVTAVRRWRGRR